MDKLKKGNSGKVEGMDSSQGKKTEVNILEEYAKITEVRSPELKKNLNTRLNRMQGQMKGVQQMVENDRYYADLVIQGISLISALKSFCRIVLEDHLKTTVLEEMKDGEEVNLKEFSEMLKKVMM